MVRDVRTCRGEALFPIEFDYDDNFVSNASPLQNQRRIAKRWY